MAIFGQSKSTFSFLATANGIHQTKDYIEFKNGHSYYSQHYKVGRIEEPLSKNYFYSSLTVLKKNNLDVKGVYRANVHRRYCTLKSETKHCSLKPSFPTQDQGQSQLRKGGQIFIFSCLYRPEETGVFHLHGITGLDKALLQGTRHKFNTIPSSLTLQPINHVKILIFKLLLFKVFSIGFYPTSSMQKGFEIFNLTFSCA